VRVMRPTCDTNEKHEIFTVTEMRMQFDISRLSSYVSQYTIRTYQANVECTL